MQRRRYLVAYDISDDKRLRRVMDVSKDFGRRLQYSVFLCDLDPIERVLLRSELRREMDEHVDRICIIDLGAVESLNADTFEFLGRRPGLPQRGARIL